MQKKTIILIIILVLVIGAGALWYAKSYIKAPVMNNNKVNVNKINEIDTSDWQIYQNEEYGINFRYPKGFYSLSEQVTVDSFYKYFSNENVKAPLEMSNDGIFISIRITNNEDFLNLEEIAFKCTGNPKETRITKVKNFHVDNIPALQQFENLFSVDGTEGGEILATYILINNLIYKISLYAYSDITLNKYRYLYDSMLQNFSLIDK